MLNGLCYMVLFGTILVAAELPAIFSAMTIDVYTTFTVGNGSAEVLFYAFLPLHLFALCDIQRSTHDLQLLKKKL